MTMTAKDIELALWRSGLINPKVCKTLIQDNCGIVARNAAKFDRARLAECNGLPQSWDPVRREYVMGLTEKNQADLESIRLKTKAAMKAALQEILTRGLIYDFRSDPRGAILRIVNKENTKDAWVS